MKLARRLKENAIGDWINISSQIFVKSLSIPLSLVMIGWASRAVAGADKYVLLSFGNYIALLGLLQLGLGTYMFRTLTHQWAETHELQPSEEVRSAFVLTCGIAALTLCIIAALVASGKWPTAILPALIVVIVGLPASFADQVRMARGQAYVSNSILLAAYLTSFLAMVILLRHERPSVSLILLAIFAPAYFSSMASFLLLLRQPFFRKLILYDASFSIREPLQQSSSIFFVSMGAALLLNVPLAAKVIPGFPTLSYGQLACLRLTVSAININAFCLQPIAPIVLRSFYGTDFRSKTKSIVGTILCLNVLAGGAFALVAPTFVKVWLGSRAVTQLLALSWGIILSTWLSVLAGVYLCQILMRSGSAAQALFLSACLGILLPLIFHLSLEIALVLALLGGLLYVSWTVSQILIRHGLRRSESK